MSTSRPAPIRLWRRILLVLAVWLASLPVAELAFRFVGIRTANLTDGIYQAFGDNGYRLRPNNDAYMNWYPHGFTVITDSRGFRVSAPTEETSAPDVLVVGDSQAFGTGLDHEQSVIGQFAKHAAENGIQVANAAIGGHLLRNQLELIQHLRSTAGLHFKCLLICLTPRGIHQGGEYNQNHVHAGGLYSGPPSRLLLARKWLMANSAAFTVLRNAYRSLTATHAKTSASLAWYEAGETERRKHRELSAVVRDLLAVAKEEGATCALAYFPVVGEERILASAPPGGEFSLDTPRRILGRIAEQARLPLIDLGPAVAQVVARGERASLEGDPHYGRATSAACGKLLWTALDWSALVGRGRGGDKEK